MYRRRLAKPCWVPDAFGQLAVQRLALVQIRFAESGA
jgi:hypothetical protein